MGVLPAAAFSAPVYIYGGGFALPIPAVDDPDSEYGKGWMSDAVIDVPDHFTVCDVDVAITVTHTSAFDLQIFLQGPAGQRICLNMYDPYTGFFEGADYTQTIFDDEAETAIEQAEAPFTGRFRPKAGYSLQLFDGQDTCGQWRLQIYDAYYGDSGTLDSFELIITVPEPATATLMALGLGLLMSRRYSRKL